MRVVVAMSGGVDSSVAALLMHQAGHEVIGIALQLWDYSKNGESHSGSCCSPDDLYDARRVAEKLAFPFYVVNSEAEFRRYVVDAFTESYARALTPNPCVHCNDTVKFERLIQLSEALGADMLATGHYARKAILPDGNHVLRRAIDAAKDQTYFLFRLDQARLRQVIFPLGELTKPEVRALAEASGLPTASKHESQELCFVPDNDYVRFIEAEGVTSPPGDIVDLDGQVLGSHRGLHHYTIGQRKGLGIAASEPLYVVGLDIARNRVVVGANHHLFQDGLVAGQIQWVAGAPSTDMELSARIRYRATAVPIELETLPGNQLAVRFAQPQRAITPGQAVVFYHGDLVLGGGWIERALQPTEHRDSPDWVV